MNLEYYLLSAVAALIALTVHEYCHGYAAYKLGDNTAKNLGRLTLNPMHHLDLYGTVCMIFFHIGWAKPVPINPRNFKDPKKGFAITAAAGPVANLVIGFFSALIFLLFRSTINSIPLSEFTNFSLKLAVNTDLFLQIFFSVNIGLGLFNLLPIPPFDGSRLLTVFLPPKTYFAIMKYEKKIYYGVLAWLLFGSYAAQGVRMIPMVANSTLLYKLAGVLSLSGMLSKVISWVCNLFLDFWQLLPFLQI